MQSDGSAVRVLGYTRRSKAEDPTGASIPAQRAVLEGACAERGWSLVDILEEDGVSGRRGRKRPALDDALARLDAAEADVFLVARLDRLARSSVDFGLIAERASRGPWTLVLLDPQVDGCTPYGKAMLQMAAIVAELESDLISVRTREALAIKRQQGVRFGPPPQIPKKIRNRIVREHAAGRPHAQIARDLEKEGVPTVKVGARWHGSTITSVVRQSQGLPGTKRRPSPWTSYLGRRQPTSQPTVADRPRGRVFTQRPQGKIVSRSRRRTTGTVTTVLRAAAGEYVLMCEEHLTCAATMSTREGALAKARHPRVWCPGCKAPEVQSGTT
jgi:DNA invertase Pin-like site-specific DNA recombinase